MRLIYILFWLFLVNKSYAWDLFWVSRLRNSELNHWNENMDLVLTIDNLLAYFIWLLYFIAVAMWLYWWFTILTSGWEEEKVKKWKNLILYMIIWLIIIFLSSIIVKWVISVMSKDEIIGL